MIFKIGEDPYTVSFSHEQCDSMIRPNIWTRGATLCTIRRGNQEILRGIAYCSLGENNFVKAKGRKISLTEALHTVTDKEFRRTVWQEYWKSCKKK